MYAAIVHVPLQGRQSVKHRCGNSISTWYKREAFLKRQLQPSIVGSLRLSPDCVSCSDQDLAELPPSWWGVGADVAAPTPPAAVGHIKAVLVQ